MRFEIKCDFDGTITTRDSTDFILENFALPQWQEIEKDWENGMINSHQCMKYQAALISSTPDNIYQRLNELDVDPFFKDFINFCDVRNISVSILSDGYDLNINHVMKKMGLERLEVISNSLEYIGNKKFALTSPNSRPDCKSKAGTCKCAQLKKDVYTIFIGDGRSDFCVASEADIVLAKSSLLDFCRKQKIPHIEFHNFYDVEKAVSYILNLSSIQPDYTKRGSAFNILQSHNI